MRRPVRTMGRVLRAAGRAAARRRQAARRAVFVATVGARARWHGARVVCAVAPDVVLGRRLVVRVAPGTSSELRLGPGCRIGDDVRVELRGGALVLGHHVDVRPRCVIGVAGRLEMAGPALVQHGCTLHCDESVTLAPYAGIGEYVTIIDSSHNVDGPSRWFVDDLRSAPVVVGAHAWVGAKATVTRGVRLGDRCVVGANSTVVKDVAPGAFVSGVPAAVVRTVTRRSRPAGASRPEAAAVGVGAHAPQAPATVAGITPDPGRMPIDVLSRSR